METKRKNLANILYKIYVDDGEIYIDLKFTPSTEHVMVFLVTSEHKIFFSLINPSENENSRVYYPHPLD